VRQAEGNLRRGNRGRRGRTGLGLWSALVLLLAIPVVARAQDTSAVRLEIRLGGVTGTRDPLVRTRNLLEETPWLATLRQGLPVRLQYRLEVWRSREGWFDVLERQLDWTVVVRHEPVLDQFSVVSLYPNNSVQRRTAATPGALAGMLGIGYQFTVAPRTEGRYYYTASLEVATLSDSDLDAFDQVLRGELSPRSGGGSLGQRARRLVLRLAGIPTMGLTTRSENFEISR
jgi:hypothetical protein